MKLSMHTLLQQLLATAALALAASVAMAGTITPERYQAVVDEALKLYQDVDEGKNADYIPILTKTPSDLFGVVIATRDGKIYSAGEIGYEFSIQSVSKPFTAALIMATKGPQELREKIGVEPTGLPFNCPFDLRCFAYRW